jgi:hypothetical protein
MTSLTGIDRTYGAGAAPASPGSVSFAERPSQAKAAQAPYFSPVFRFDPLGQELIVEFRDSATGEVEQKYPSLWIEQAYQLTGRVEAKGPVAVAHEQKQAVAAAAGEPSETAGKTPISLVA